MEDAMYGTEQVADFATAARDRRRALGLSQQDLADLAGVSARFVHSLEHGKPTVRLDKVLAVFGVLGLQLEIETRQ
jgi:HTH-type transcriptional regulator / antitoxin HipB